LQFLIDEYRLLYTIHSFRKPVVAILDGIATGGGMGLAQGAQLRVATNRAKLATPGTRFGSFPDVGATWFLASMPAALDLYVGLTGALLSGPDALLCNLADICVPSEWLETFEERLECMPLVGPGELLPALRAVFEPPANVVPHSALSEYMPLVIRHFDERMTVLEMVTSLEWAWREEPSPSMRRWLRAARDALIGNSPIMLNVAREALLRGRKLTLADCFRKELEMVSAAVRASDFSEGVRAHLIDRDRHPRWKPSSLGEVTRDQIRFFMASPWSQKTHPLGDLDRL
jgi:enoyl-CoA hydratase/carnithine racemase